MDNLQIGLNIKDLRRKKNLTQEQLGSSLNVTKQQILLYEKGKIAKIETLKSIADALQCSVYDLQSKSENKVDLPIEPSAFKQLYDKAITDIEWYKNEIVRLTEQNGQLIAKYVVNIDTALFTAVRRDTYAILT